MSTQDQKQLQGKICLVTGATSGIGKATAIGLAQQDATVVIVARNQARGEAALQEIRAASDNTKVDLLLADLSAQASIHQLAATFRERYPHLHILVNNAGVFQLKRLETVDGLEMTFAVNHLSPFLLSHLLLDRLHADAPARIVNVCSGAHTSGRIDLDDLQLRKSYNFWRAYAQSKLAMLLCSYKLARQLEGTGVTVNCVHPGFVATNIGLSSVGPRSQAVAKTIISWLGASPEKGAQTSLYVATSTVVESVTGKYFANSRPVQSSRSSYDEVLQERIWEASVRLVNLPATSDTRH